MIRKLTFTALFVAIGVLLGNLVYIPIGMAKCFPIQHAINVLLAVLLGTRYSVSAAFCISLLRNLFGTGTLLAFPGSMIGAALAGYMYKKTHHIGGAILGEVIGTGLIGGLLAVPLAQFVMGTSVGALLFIMPFSISTIGGSILAYVIYKTPVITFLRQRLVK